MHTRLFLAVKSGDDVRQLAPCIEPNVVATAGVGLDNVWVKDGSNVSLSVH